MTSAFTDLERVNKSLAKCKPSFPLTCSVFAITHFLNYNTFQKQNKEIAVEIIVKKKNKNTTKKTNKQTKTKWHQQFNSDGKFTVKVQMMISMVLSSQTPSLYYAQCNSTRRARRIISASHGNKAGHKILIMTVKYFTMLSTPCTGKQERRHLQNYDKIIGYTENLNRNCKIDINEE